MRKIIIFDLDNTFYNYENSHSAALKAVFSSQKEFGDYEKFYIKYEQTKKKVQKRLPGNPSRHSKLIYFKDLFYEKIDLQKIYELESIYWDSFITSTEIDKDSVNLLSNEKGIDDLYYLFTNQNTNVQLKKINSWGLNFFDLVITSEETGFEKPNQNFFNYADSFVMESAKKENSQVFSIGDDYKNDIKFWQDKYKSRSYLIDNNISESQFISGSFIDSTGQTFSTDKELVKTSFKFAIKDIFKS